jgi:8-oxo-dGTP pyrophosphatase MutT (NUDIX family)
MQQSNKEEKEKTVKKIKNIYCVNCGEKGHIVRVCSAPITSLGIIAFKVVHNEEQENADINQSIKEILNTLETRENDIYPKVKFLMIQRKDTMGFIDFIRGKYPEQEPEKSESISTLFGEMTHIEKTKMLSKSFDDIWREIWNNHDSKCFKNEYELAKKKYEALPIPELVNSHKSIFSFQEFGFPKGRRNMKESNIGCAEREFQEETGYDKSSYEFIKNYPLIQEEFIGTNGVRYRHIYYLVKMKSDVQPPKIDWRNKVQTGEVQNIGWLTYEQCISVIRPYDIAKIEMLGKVYSDILSMNGKYETSPIYIIQKTKLEPANNADYLKFMQNMFISSRQYLVDSDELIKRAVKN